MAGPNVFRGRDQYTRKEDNFVATALAAATALKPNSITLAASKLVRSWSQTGLKLVADQLRTSFEPDSVMEFGFLPRELC